MISTTAAESAVLAAPTFGRDGVMFQNLLEFVAQLSLVLWSVVIVTVVIRFVGVRIYRPRHARRTALGSSAGTTAPALARTVVPGTVPTPTRDIDAVSTMTGDIDVIEPGDEVFVGDLLLGKLTEEAEVGSVPAASAASPREVVQLPAYVAPGKAPRRALRKRSAAPVRALASNSTEA
jgi:hypothetical protein